MKCAPDTKIEPAGGAGPVAVAVVTTDAFLVGGDFASPITSELELEAEMNRRASAMTDVLARIMERPTTPRHWGLNE